MELSGELVFLKYAWPCVDDKIAKGIISQVQKRELEICLKENRRPRRRLLKTCFSTAFYKMRDHAQTRRIATWDIHNVRDYWMNYHDGINGCAVKILRVVEINNKKIVAYGQQAEKYKIANIYDLHLQEKDCIICHKNCAIEKV